MTTREELVDGFRMILREGLRTTRDFTPDDWTYEVHDEEGGWTVKQVYCHLTVAADTVPSLVAAWSQAPEGKNITADLDIDAFNAQSVAAREGMSEAELLAAFKASYEKAIEFVLGMPEEQLQRCGGFGAIEAPVADLLATFFVLHPLAHIANYATRTSAQQLRSG